ncbi:hypothetical protein WME94_12605 [Sorangium sp. So ce429]
MSSSVRCEVHWYETVKTSILRWSGEVQVACFSIDVTERQRAQEALGARADSGEAPSSQLARFPRRPPDGKDPIQLWMCRVDKAVDAPVK